VQPAGVRGGQDQGRERQVGGVHTPPRRPWQSHETGVCGLRSRIRREFGLRELLGSGIAAAEEGEEEHLERGRQRPRFGSRLAVTEKFGLTAANVALGYNAPG